MWSFVMLKSTFHCPFPAHSRLVEVPTVQLFPGQFHDSLLGSFSSTSGINEAFEPLLLDADDNIKQKTCKMMHLYISHACTVDIALVYV